MKIKSFQKRIKNICGERSFVASNLKSYFTNLIKKIALYSLAAWFGVVFIGFVFYQNFGKYEEKVNPGILAAPPIKKVVAATTTENYIIQDYQGKKLAIIKLIKPIFDEAKVPQSVWLTIAICESELNTYCMLDNRIETSKGLFQINVVANPEFKNEDLFNPETNAKIACKHFISSAYAQAKNISGIALTRALITYSGLYNPYGKSKYIREGGIKPLWTAALRTKFIGIYNSVKYLDDEKGPASTSPSSK